MVQVSIGDKFGPSNLRVGQVWEYREYKDTDWCDVSSCVSYDDYVNAADNSCEIMKINTKTGFMGVPAGRLIVVKFLKADQCPYEAGDTLQFTAEGFDTFFRLLWDSEAKEKYGVYCGNCGKYNEYAKFHEGFKCWACRNGWTT